MLFFCDGNLAKSVNAKVVKIKLINAYFIYPKGLDFKVDKRCYLVIFHNFRGVVRFLNLSIHGVVSFDDNIIYKVTYLNHFINYDFVISFSSIFDVQIQRVNSHSLKKYLIMQMSRCTFPRITNQSNFFTCFYALPFPNKKIA